MTFRRLLFALTAGLVVLAAGLIYSGSRPSRFTASARVDLAPPSDGERIAAGGDLDVDALAASLTSRDGVFAALAAIDQTEGRGNDPSQTARRQALALALRTSLEVRPTSDSSFDETRLLVQYTGVDRGAAARVVGKVARQLARRYADAIVASAQSSYETARDDAQQTRQQWSDAQTALDQALTEHLAVTDTPSMANSHGTAGPAGIGTAASGNPSRQENPAWTNLANEVARVEAGLAELHKAKTSVHPLVEVAVWRLEQLKGQLEQTPRFDPETSGPRVLINDGEGQWSIAEADADATEDIGRQTPSLDIAAGGDTLANVRQRQDQLATSADRYVAATAALHTAGQRLAAANASQNRPVQIDTTGGPAGRRQGVLGSLATAVVALLVSLAVACTGRQTVRVLRTVEGARKRLSMPIVGVISTG